MLHEIIAFFSVLNACTSVTMHSLWLAEYWGTGRKGALGSPVFPVLCHHGQCQWLAYPGNNSSKKGSERVPGPLKFLRAPLPSCPWQVLVGGEDLVSQGCQCPCLPVAIMCVSCTLFESHWTATLHGSPRILCLWATKHYMHLGPQGIPGGSVTPRLHISAHSCAPLSHQPSLTKLMSKDKILKFQDSYIRTLNQAGPSENRAPNSCTHCMSMKLPCLYLRLSHFSAAPELVSFIHLALCVRD
jgi:hypothetical protein